MILAQMTDLQYREHKLAEKAQRIIDINQELQKLEVQKEELQAKKPACKKSNLTYEESIEFGKKVDQFQNKLRKIKVKRLKLQRQLSALELQASKLMPVKGIKIKVSKYSAEGCPQQTYCVEKKEYSDKSETECPIKVERL